MYALTALIALSLATAAALVSVLQDVDPQS